jgi:hypothetical protein
MNKQLIVAACIAATVVASTVGAGSPSAAQTETPPVPTQIPVRFDIDAPAPEAIAPAKAARADLVSWSPDGGQLRIEGGKVVVNASTTSSFDANTARYSLELPASGGGTTFGAEQTPEASFTNSNKNVRLTATVNAAGAIAIVFSIREVSEVSGQPGVKHEKRYTLGRGVFLPATMRDYMYPPLNVAAISGNSSPCTAVGSMAGSGRVYQATIGGANQSDVDDWYYSTVNAGTTFRVTVTDAPTTGTQLQLFVINSQDCNSVPGSATTLIEIKSATSTLTRTVTADGRVYFRVVGLAGLPFAAYKITVDDGFGGGGGGGPQDGVFEDNDNPCQATRTSPNTVYSSNVDDEYDFYEIVVPTAGYLRVYLEDYNAPSQMQIRSAQINTACDPVNSTTRVDPVAFVVNNKADWIKWVPAGTYYARIGPTAARSTIPYRFVWWTTPQPTAGRTEICEAFNTCDAPLIGQNKVTLYWKDFALNNGFPTSLKFETELVSEAVLRCPLGASGQKVTFETTSSTGNKVYENIKKGYYKLKVRVFSGLAQVHYVEHAVKMDCEFLAANGATDAMTASNDSSLLPVDPGDVYLPGPQAPAP